MLRKLTLLNLFLLAAMLFTACTPAAKTPEAMMATTPTTAMMDHPTQTVDAMMQPTDAMMDQGTPTVDAMMAQGTPTADAMMGHSTPTTDAMMDHGTATPTAGAMMDQGMTTPTGDAMMPPASTPGASMDQSIPSTGMGDVMMAAWTAKALTNPVSGKTFKINDFKGKVVLLQPFAQMCETCLAQQQEVAKLHKMIGMNSDLVTVSLDIAPGEDATTLKAYLNKHGFDWNFAVAPADVSQGISQLYGGQLTNPAAAPLLVIDRKGEAHLLPAGVQSAEDLQKALEPYLKASM